MPQTPISHRSPPHLATMILLVAVVVLTLNMFLPALPHMAAEFAVSEAQMGIAVSGYMIAAGVLQLAIGPISDRVGRRPVVLVAVGGYVLASAGAALATSFLPFLICRLGQSLALAASVAGMAALRDMYSTREAAGKMGTIAAAMAVAPMVGPTLGGVLETTLGWRAIFGLYAAVGAAGLVLAWFDWGETLPENAERGGQAQSYGALMRSGPFWAYALCTTFSVGVFYIFITGVPFVALHAFELSSAWIGVGIGSTTCGFMFGSTLTARYAPKLGLAPLILVGRLMAVVALAVGLAVFAVWSAPAWLMFTCALFVGFGNGLTVSNTNAGMISIRPDLAGSAAGLSGALQLLGGAALTAVTLVLLAPSPTPMRLLALMLGVAGLALITGVLAVRNGARD